MDFTAFLPYLPYIFQLMQYAGQIKSALDQATSNDDVVTKIKAVAPVVADMLSVMGASLFPKAAASIHIAAAATAAYDPDVVKWVQGACNKIVTPSPSLVVDGIYGKLTRGAVERLQTQLGLKVDGYAGQLTQAAIGMALMKV